MRLHVNFGVHLHFCLFVEVIAFRELFHSLGAARVVLNFED
jgi:hypothetical protein